MVETLLFDDGRWTEEGDKKHSLLCLCGNIAFFVFWLMQLFSFQRQIHRKGRLYSTWKCVLFGQRRLNHGTLINSTNTQGATLLSRQNLLENGQVMNHSIGPNMYPIGPGIFQNQMKHPFGQKDRFFQNKYPIYGRNRPIKKLGKEKQKDLFVWFLIGG